MVCAQGRGGSRHSSRLSARWHRQWAALGSAAAGLTAVVAQARGSDCCARLIMAQGKLRAQSSRKERRALEGGSQQGRLRGNVI